MSVAFRPVFLSKGVTSACFISVGIVADFNDILMIFASNGTLIFMFVFNSVVGHVSRAQYFERRLCNTGGQLICIYPRRAQAAHPLTPDVKCTPSAIPLAG